MFCFNLFVILVIDFHVHFRLLFSKRAHFKGYSEKMAHRQKTLKERGRRGRRADAPSVRPAPEGLHVASFKQTYTCCCTFVRISPYYFWLIMWIKKANNFQIVKFQPQDVA